MADRQASCVHVLSLILHAFIFVCLCGYSYEVARPHCCKAYIYPKTPILFNGVKCKCGLSHQEEYGLDLKSYCIFKAVC